jgi:hypothetical protein
MQARAATLPGSRREAVASNPTQDTAAQTAGRDGAAPGSEAASLVTELRDEGEPR